MRRVLRRRLQSVDHHLLDLIDRDRRLAPGPRPIDQTIETIGDKTGTPLAHGIRRAAHTLGNRLVIYSLATRQHDP